MTTDNRLDAKLDLHQTYRLAELGKLSATMLHEITNPLTAAQLHLSQIEDTPAVRRARRSVQTLSDYIEAVQRQIGHAGPASSFRLAPELDQICRLIMPLAIRARVGLAIGPLPDCLVLGDSSSFRRLLAGTLINAIESSEATFEPGKQVSVSVTSDSQYVMIEVEQDVANRPQIYIDIRMPLVQD